MNHHPFLYIIKFLIKRDYLYGPQVSLGRLLLLRTMYKSLGISLYPGVPVTSPMRLPPSLLPPCLLAGHPFTLVWNLENMPSFSRTVYLLEDTILSSVCLFVQIKEMIKGQILLLRLDFGCHDIDMIWYWSAWGSKVINWWDTYRALLDYSLIHVLAT